MKLNVINYIIGVIQVLIILKLHRTPRAFGRIPNKRHPGSDTAPAHTCFLSLSNLLLYAERGPLTLTNSHAAGPRTPQPPTSAAYRGSVSAVICGTVSLIVLCSVLPTRAGQKRHGPLHSGPSFRGSRIIGSLQDKASCKLQALSVIPTPARAALGDSHWPDDVNSVSSVADTTWKSLESGTLFWQWFLIPQSSSIKSHELDRCTAWLCANIIREQVSLGMSVPWALWGSPCCGCPPLHQIQALPYGESPLESPPPQPDRQS